MDKWSRFKMFFGENYKNTIDNYHIVIYEDNEILNNLLENYSFNYSNKIINDKIIIFIIIDDNVKIPTINNKAFFIKLYNFKDKNYLYFNNISKYEKLNYNFDIKKDEISNNFIFGLLFNELIKFIFQKNYVFELITIDLNI